MSRAGGHCRSVRRRIHGAGANRRSCAAQPRKTPHGLPLFEYSKDRDRGLDWPLDPWSMRTPEGIVCPLARAFFWAADQRRHAKPQRQRHFNVRKMRTIQTEY
jgi:hypothetical protein